MKTTTWRRAATTVVAAASALAMTASGAGAAATGPAVFSGSAEALTFDLTLTAPAELLGTVGSLLGSDEGSAGTLSQRVSSTISQLDSAGRADATSKLLSGLVNEAISSVDGDENRSLIPEQNIGGGLLQLGVGTMEYTADATGHLSRSFSELAHLRVSVEPLFADESLLPAELRGTVQDTVATATDTVNGLVGELNGVLGEVETAVNEVVGGAEEATGVDIPDVLPDTLPQVPDITRVPLLEARKMWSESTVTTDADSVVSTSDAGIVEASLLGGLVRVPAFQYTSIARTNGQPGGAFADATTKVIAVQLADDTLIEVAGSTLTVGDFQLDLNDPELAGLPTDELLTPVKDVLGQILDAAGLSVAQGAAQTFAAEDGSRAEASTSAFALSLHPLNAAGEDANRLFGVDLNLLPTKVQAAAANPPAEVEAPAAPAPAPAPETPVQLPRTGGGAASLVLGAVAMAGAYGLRRR